MGLLRQIASELAKEGIDVSAPNGGAAPGGVGTDSRACAGNQADLPGVIDLAVAVRSAYVGASQQKSQSARLGMPWGFVKCSAA